MKTAPPPLEAIVIGGSAGAVSALGEILPHLDRDFPPVLVVVHVPAGMPSLFTSIYGSRCAMRVVEASPADSIERGTIYFAPPDYHLLVEPDRRCALSIGPPIHFSRPAIDALFESAAEVYGEALAGIVLTGASADGASGLAAIARAGGRALVQDPRSAEAPTMPSEALAAVPSARVVSLAEVLDLLKHLHSLRSMVQS